MARCRPDDRWETTTTPATTVALAAVAKSGSRASAHRAPGTASPDSATSRPSTPGRWCADHSARRPAGSAGSCAGVGAKALRSIEPGPDGFGGHPLLHDVAVADRPPHADLPHGRQQHLVDAGGQAEGRRRLVEAGPDRRGIQNLGGVQDLVDQLPAPVPVRPTVCRTDRAATPACRPRAISSRINRSALTSSGRYLRC